MHPILLYDGVCGLCNRFVQFILRRDRHAIFRFAPLQGDFAVRILARHNLSLTCVDTLYVVVNPESDNPGLESTELLLSRSDAALYVFQHLTAPWRAAGFLLRLLPKRLRDSAYNLIARNRYRIFGRFDTCALPNPQHKGRFLDT
jgi:predicted DCC family thiol-disulfide oxidoreductase YuxK